jgi:membrane protein DedA with SNARE-associated domain
MPPAAFEPATPASEWPHTHALEPAAIGIGKLKNYTFFLLTSITTAISFSIQQACCWQFRSNSKQLAQDSKAYKNCN